MIGSCCIIIIVNETDHIASYIIAPWYIFADKIRCVLPHRYDRLYE